MAMDTLSDVTAVSPTRTDAEDFLQSVKTTPRQMLSHRALLRMVAQITGVSADVLKGKGRMADVAKARQILFWLCRQFTDLTLPQIARLTGGRNHTTVLYGFGKVQIVRSRLSVTAHADPVSWAIALWSVAWPSVELAEVQSAWAR